MKNVKQKFQTHYSGHHVLPESFTIPSRTVPDLTLSIPEILERHTRNAPLNVPIHKGEEDLFDGVNLATLDIVELYEMQEANKIILDDYRKGQLLKKQNAVKEAYDAEIARRVKEELANSKKPEAPQA